MWINFGELIMPMSISNLLHECTSPLSTQLPYKSTVYLSLLMFGVSKSVGPADGPLRVIHKWRWNTLGCISVSLLHLGYVTVHYAKWQILRLTIFYHVAVWSVPCMPGKWGFPARAVIRYLCSTRAQDVKSAAPRFWGIFAALCLAATDLELIVQIQVNLVELLRSTMTMVQGSMTRAAETALVRMYE